MSRLVAFPSKHVVSIRAIPTAPEPHVLLFRRPKNFVATAQAQQALANSKPGAKLVRKK